jgi:signal peptidase II
MRVTRRGVIFLAMLLATLALDQGSKSWARTLPVEPAGCTTAALAAHACRGVPQSVIAGYWDWELAQNDGAAFSSFRGSRVVLTLLGLGALVMLGVMAARTTPDQRLKRAALAMIAGGALGNLLDRVSEGSVTDFVRWHYHEHLWPIFNVADVVLVIGVALLMMESVLGRRRPATLPG